MPSILTLRRTIGDQSVTEAEGRLASAVGVRGAGEVVEPGDFGDIDFFVDWRTATGTGGTAVTDGSKLPSRTWNNVDPLLSVVSASGLGFPSGMAHVLRQDFDEAEGDAVYGFDLFPEISVGQTRWFRIYMLYDVPDGAGIGSSYHPYQAALQVAWEFKPINPGASTFRFTFQPRREGPGVTYDWMTAPLRTVLRLEFAMERTSATVIRFPSCVVYAPDGSVLATEADFIESAVGPATWGSVAPEVTIGEIQQDLRGLLVGNNGPAGNPYVGGAIYFGGFATCIGAPPAPYTETFG